MFGLDEPGGGFILQMIGIVNLIVWLSIIVLGIYSFVLFIKLARRGIKALDIYIGKNRDKNM
jgi:hypothetical protein